MPTDEQIEKAVNYAASLVNSGRNDEAVKILDIVYPITTDKPIKLKIIDAYLSGLDSIDNYERLLSLCDEGIAISKELVISSFEAYFMSMKAGFLLIKTTILDHHLKNLKLTPGWLGFSLEVEKDQYKTLLQKYRIADKEIDTLLENALLVVDDKDIDTKGRILTKKGEVANSKYLVQLSDYLRSGKLLKLWLKYTFLRHPFYQPLFFSRAARKKLKQQFNLMTENFLAAARMYQDGESYLEGVAYYNLANNLRTAFLFKKANKYLGMADSIAQKHNDKLTILKIKDLRESIKLKNKDVPNYIEGERRKKT